ncbi:protein MIZU-KUSSEI 1 [Tanacetum coccineum]
MITTIFTVGCECLGPFSGKILQEMGLGLVRIAMEWYGVKREPTDDYLYVMQLLHAISMGAGVLPASGSDSNNNSDKYVIAETTKTVHH